MIQMNTLELCKALNGELIAGFSNEFSGVSIDSRKIESGQLFFAIVGEKMDGHKFVEDALIQGGTGAIVDCEMDIELKEGQFLIKVKDTTSALQDLAHYYRKKFDIKVVGITGSAGKTTTKDMIASVLREKYNVLKTEGNLNNYYGLPLTLFQLKSEHEVLVVEMGMSDLKEIELLAKLAEPEFGVVTNIGHSHLEHLKTLDNVVLAKQELIENLVGQRIAILNVDDYRVRKMSALADQAVFFGMDELANYRALKVDQNELKGMKIILEGEKISFDIPLPGEHNVYNALAAIAVGRVLGVSFSKIQEGLKNFQPSKMRMNISKLGENITLLNDAYNANPDSMQANLEVLANCSGRKIAVVGDMLELGSFAEKSHFDIGRFAALKGIDLIFIKGDYRKFVAEGAVAGGLSSDKIFTFASNLKLAEQLLDVVQPGDTILIKGSRGMKMEEVAKILGEKIK
ncbi:MAG: UDP-N-acetylmuramoyl-tripeptide--D-alanyl-D-alanine ligase [Halanaerobiales bacterium]|nr:UDP-N-acetylmuramoyl-tripeptide--D-alanyl-D-alanine ligase [Halanaerobiales bacterium]